LKDGEVLLQSKYISVDPYLHFRRVVGEVPVSLQVAEVVDAKEHKTFKKGDVVRGVLPWKRYNVSDGTTTTGPLLKIDPSLAPPETFLGIFGGTGMSAYFGLLDVASLKDGEQVLISGAAGAVGLVAGQIAKIKGCHVVGTAGGKEKCALLKEFGFDVAIDYKEHSTVDQVKAALAKAFPKGIDVYFDNTGGHVTEAFFDLTNRFARVAVCGQISHYTNEKPAKVDSFLGKLVYKAVTVKGFYVTDYFHRAGEFMKDMAGWYKAGKLKSKDTIYKGFEHLPAAQVGLFSGKNTGKALVEL